MPGTFARTRELSEAWTDTLEIDALTTWDTFWTSPCDNVSASGLGGSATISLLASFSATISPAVISWHFGEDTTETRALAQSWVDLHTGYPGITRYGQIWQKVVSAPGMWNSQRSLVCNGEYPSGGPLPIVYSWEGVTSLSLSVSCTLNGVWVCERRTDAVHTDRTSPRDPTDQTRELHLYADPEATVTVSGGGLTVTGALSWAGGWVDMGTGFSFSVDVINNYFPAANTSYGKHVSPACFGKDASLVESLYKPGTGDEPDATNYPGWKRSPPASGAYLKLVNDGGIALQRSASVGWNIGTSYIGGVSRGAPMTLQYRGKYAKEFDPDGPSESALICYGEPRTWHPELGSSGEWVADTWAFGADYSQTMWWRSELLTTEWQLLDLSQKSYVTQASRVAQGEDVGGTTPATNDAQLLFATQPISGGLVGEPIWGPFLTLAHATSLNVNDPPGASNRPSLWTGGAGVTVDPTNNDRWTAAAGTPSPAVSRSLTNRYELRMDWLANHPETENYHNVDAPYILRRNRAGETYATFGDNPAWWSTAAGGCDEEDVWHYGEWGYLLVGLTAPKAGTVTLKLTCKVPTVNDPCYEGFGYRYGHLDDSGFSISYTTRTATYSFPVAEGANTVQVDLCKPAEGFVPEGEYRLCVVKELAWTFPAAGGTDEEWDLTGLALVLDTEHTSLVTSHNKRHWNWMSYWVGFAAEVDGKPALQVDPGFRRWQYEQGLQGTQLVQHNPDSEATDDPTYAKNLNRISTESDLCEGWSASWLDPVNSSNNKDLDDICYAPTMYFWDLQHQQQSSLSGAVCVGQAGGIYGAAVDLYYTCFPRGKVSGLLFEAGARKRSSGAVWLYKCATATGTYSRVGSIVPDGQGQFRSSELLEKAWFYGVVNRDLGATADAVTLAFSGLQVANREYTFCGILNLPVTVKDGVAMFRHPGGNVPWTAWIDANGYVRIIETDSGVAGMAVPVTVDASGSYDSVDAECDGAVVYVDARNSATGQLTRFTSTDGGAHFASQGVITP